VKALWSSAPGLFFVTGGLLGLTLPLGKLAGQAGVPPTVWALTISLGAGAILALARALAGHRGAPNGAEWRFYLVAGLISYALPNLLMFSVMPHVGAGFTGLFFTLSPVATLTLAVLLRVQRTSRLGVIGIAIGFLGAVVVSATRGQLGAPAGLGWIALGMLVPLFLAAGNIYRTVAWPPGGHPVALAAGSHLAAAAMLGVLLLLTGETGAVATLAAIPGIALTQAVAAAATFAVFFRLQAVGGPVYLSQIGYVAAAVGLVSGVAFLGERYGLATWTGAGLICLGVALATRAQARG
jgi:drug/metabolite transporter (DMT)-like permease